MVLFRFSIPKQSLLLITCFVFILGLTGCALGPVPPCPEVRIDSKTASYTVFKDGPGRDITDIAYDAEIVSFEGTCEFDDDGVEVNMDMDMMISGGPAVEPGPIDLYYFVAIPRFHPDPAGKKVFNRGYTIPRSGPRRERITESNIRVYIPLESEIVAGGYIIYLGFQLTNEQLEYNRSRRG